MEAEGALILSSVRPALAFPVTGHSIPSADAALVGWSGTQMNPSAAGHMPTYTEYYQHFIDHPMNGGNIPVHNPNDVQVQPQHHHHHQHQQHQVQQQQSAPTSTNT